MGRIRLKFKSVTEIVGTDEIGLLILVDESELRQIAITCDRMMLEQFHLRLSGALPADASSGNSTALLLPETLWKVVSKMVDGNFDIVIYGLEEGQYKTVLYNDVTFDRFPIQPSDAILLSLIARVPVFIEEQLMATQSSPYHPTAKGMAIPVNTISSEMLEKALEKAIEEENYELASYLRDEQRRRLSSRESV